MTKPMADAVSRVESNGGCCFRSAYYALLRLKNRFIRFISPSFEFPSRELRIKYKKQAFEKLRREATGESNAHQETTPPSNSHPGGRRF